MKINGKLQGLLMAGLLAVMVSPALAQDNQENMSQYLPQIMQKGEISWTTGGFGLEERDALKATVRNYNLIISNANKEGQFTDETALVITSRGDRETLTVNDAGPLFYAKLPAGTYTVKATNGDKNSVRTVSITGKNQARVYFIW